ncbi:hypothetical protein FOQG_18204 [Fusarium oxysporum f. sp. raphani 54005]|uniref:Cdc24/Scd1 N-terminal domain-containing protein n=4 Tax=Fusarium oxysporum TaxID=5507 RepID=X0B4K8_FUSOX|nr:hypothetical protein FOQG_18204 [Fusarium oxysporum f. sp. raphani 54005]EXL64644.1 hypothetical protein FOPG_19101 [Fusarium oxysporum f. sp. conglutinans race 2 54008]KAF6515636.1 hypothetical protein HZS61_004377 [Fusarium oxysporum f. sp. conglutinans]KAG6979796.1 Rho guanine nucleotide exchange factor scd1 [Fusarium oxysporum f. sp. conglutinans]KAG7425322.1 Rho guanine nucleotide exchange factor scd1 [Fusarium oxysporum f. sp. raphani]
MADPLSLAASIAGLISITVEAVKFLSPYVSAAKETPQVAAHVYSEVQSTQVILMGLQSLTKNLSSVKVQHAALIGVNQVVAVLTDGVLLYSELYTELQSLPATGGDTKIPLMGRLQWARKESTFITLLNRLQSFKNSMTLVLMILQSDSGETAKQHQEQLSSNIKLLLESNDALSRRLMSIEDALDAQTISSRRMSFLSLTGSPSQDTTEQSGADTTQTSPALIGTSSSIGVSKFDFEDDLESSRVYRRAQRDTVDFSFRSSIARSRNWSVLSGLSLGDVSAISVIALPIYPTDLTNAQHYDFGEDAPISIEPAFLAEDQPLLMECLEIKLKMLQIPEMQRYFDEVPNPPDAFFHLWAVLRQATPLLVLVRALDPSHNISRRYYYFIYSNYEAHNSKRSIVDIDIDEAQDLSIDLKKDIILWFAQYCYDKLNIDGGDLITVEELMGGDYSGSLRVVSVLSRVTRRLEIAYPAKQTVISAKQEFEFQPLELQHMAYSQREFVGQIGELLNIKDRLEMYMKDIFSNLRELGDVQITFLIMIERNLFRSSAEQKWAPAFNYLLQNIETVAASIPINDTPRTQVLSWLKDSHSGKKEKTRVLLARCLAIMPTREKQISALWAFSEFLSDQMTIGQVQSQDICSARAAIHTAIDRLQEGVQSKESVAAIRDLERKVQDWKGIHSDILGELVLSNPLLVSMGSETRPYYGYLFRNMLVFFKEIKEKQEEIRQLRLFFKPNSVTGTQQAKFLLQGRVFLKDITAVIPSSGPDSYTCLIRWMSAPDDVKSEFSIIFADESEMRLWAINIDEYTMIAKLKEKPVQKVSEEFIEPVIDLP